MKEDILMEKAKKAIMILACLTVMLASTSLATAQTTTTNVFVDPQTHTASATIETFTVKINVTNTNTVGIAAYGINIRFDPGILVVTSCEPGGFLESSDAGTLGQQIGNHSDIGYVSLGDVLAGPGSVDGNGTLAKITFTVRGGGRCALDLYTTTLQDSNNENIDHTETDGVFIYNYIALTPQTGIAAFMIQGFGFASDSPITSIKWNDTTMVIPSLSCDDRGNFVTPAIVPDISTPGNYTVSVTDGSGNHQEAVFTLTAATGTQGPQGPKGDKGDTGAQGPAGTTGTDQYTWASLILSIIAIIIGIYVATKKKS